MSSGRRKHLKVALGVDIVLTVVKSKRLGTWVKLMMLNSGINEEMYYSVQTLTYRLFLKHKNKIYS
jgi:hypothetical protein